MKPRNERRRPGPRSGRSVSRARGSAGFSIVEIAFVLVIVGVVTSMMAPLYTPGRWRADGAVQQLALSLNAAQRLAVLRQHDVIITFALGDRAVRVHQDADNDGIQDDGEEWRVIELPETMGFGAGAVPILQGGTAPISFADGNGDPSLTFHRSGSASSTGVIYLRPMQGSLSGSTEGVRAVTVERATGEVRCWSYRSGAWEGSC